ncbi:hypothetical protein DL765_009834 [Monosporascus sp. GIB2]|nr:hypothetical protein DL765_009834 [Monosporascus sp. GIB2]
METPYSPNVDIDVSENVNSDGDIGLLDMEFDIEEDIQAELEDFIFLSRLGLFREARELFKQNLEPHLGFFPVLAEFADMLLEEGAYAELSQLLMNPTKTGFSESECQLLALMKALSEAYIEQKLSETKEQQDDAKPKLGVALDLAQNWHNGRRKATHSFSEVEVFDEATKAESLLLYLFRRKADMRGRRFDEWQHNLLRLQKQVHPAFSPGVREQYPGSLEKLDQALRHDPDAMVRLLLEKRADIDKHDWYARPALHAADLEEAIGVARKAVDATPQDHPDRARRLNNLGVRLGDRYSRTEAISDLEKVIGATGLGRRSLGRP